MSSNDFDSGVEQLKREEAKEYRHTKILCACGELVRRMDMKAHVKTFQHLQDSGEHDEIIKCACGVSYRASHEDHKYTARHKEYLERVSLLHQYERKIVFFK